MNCFISKDFLKQILSLIAYCFKWTESERGSACENIWPNTLHVQNGFNEINEMHSTTLPVLQKTVRLYLFWMGKFPESD